MNFDSVFRAYVACALWSSTDESDEAGGDPMDANYGRDDVDEKSLESMKGDCKDFIEANEEDLILSGLSDEQIGNDFWLTRNGHGAGFWDRGLGEVGDRLSKAAKVYGDVWLYVGDDDRIYQG